MSRKWTKPHLAESHATRSSQLALTETVSGQSTSSKTMDVQAKMVKILMTKVRISFPIK